MRYVRNFTLQEMCFHVVVEDLDKLIYKKTQFIPQRQIDFLLRAYSRECFLQYTKSHSKTEECLLWFLSPHNKNVFLSDVTGTIIRKLQVVGPVITSLTLRDAMISENMLNVIMSLIPNVSYLNLSHTNCSDQTLLCLGRMCPKLVTLNLEECEVLSDDGMSNLCSNHLLLKNLNILHTSVHREGLNIILTRMPSIENLHYENIADAIFEICVTSAMFNIANNIRYNLTKLVYSKLESTIFPLKVIWMCAKFCPYVKEFHLLFPVDQNVLKMCSEFSHLQKLQLSFIGNIQDIHFTDTLAPFLPLANNITKLELCSNKISPMTLIENFKNLKELYLKDASFTDFKKEEIKVNCTNLDTLNISSTDIREATTHEFLALLLSLSNNVTRLSIEYFLYIPAEFIDIMIKSMKSLSFVQFTCIGTKLPPSYLDILKIPSMKQMDVDDHTWLESAYDDCKTNSLSWRTVCDIDSDDDSDDL